MTGDTPIRAYHAARASAEAHDRKSYLTTRDVHSLHQACVPINDAFGTPPYLVGSSTERADYRDVDLRLMLPDDEYDAMFSGERGARRWSLTCWLISDWLHRQTGLPVDFQIQRRSDANYQHPKPRNPMGLHGSRLFAGRGDR